MKLPTTSQKAASSFRVPTVSPSNAVVEVLAATVLLHFFLVHSQCWYWVSRHYGCVLKDCETLWQAENHSKQSGDWYSKLCKFTRLWNEFRLFQITYHWLMNHGGKCMFSFYQKRCIEIKKCTLQCVMDGHYSSA